MQDRQAPALVKQFGHERRSVHRRASLRRYEGAAARARRTAAPNRVRAAQTFRRPDAPGRQSPRFLGGASGHGIGAARKPPDDPSPAGRPDIAPRAGRRARHGASDLCLGHDPRAPAVDRAAAEGKTAGPQAARLRPRGHGPKPQPNRPCREPGRGRKRPEPRRFQPGCCASAKRSGIM